MGTILGAIFDFVVKKYQSKKYGRLIIVVASIFMFTVFVLVSYMKFVGGNTLGG